MRKLPLMLLLFVGVLLLAHLTGCRTCPDPPAYTLAPDLPAPVLHNPAPPDVGFSAEVDEYLRELDRDIIALVSQDLRWRMRMAAARLIIGEITAMEYSAIIDDMTGRIKALPDEE